jgi:uncharacterized protein (TIGR02284 family)
MNDKAISTLNSLIETVKDGEQGFRTAAEGLQDPQVKSEFLEYSRQRAHMARELQDEVRRLGADPEKSGSVSGSVHRGWMNIKSVVTGKNDASIIAEAERGEDVAKLAFENALKEDLPSTTLALVRKQAAQVREVHDRVRALEQAGSRR